MAFTFLLGLSWHSNSKAFLHICIVCNLSQKPWDCEQKLSNLLRKHSMINSCLRILTSLVSGDLTQPVSPKKESTSRCENWLLYKELDCTFISSIRIENTMWLDKWGNVHPLIRTIGERQKTHNWKYPRDISISLWMGLCTASLQPWVPNTWTSAGHHRNCRLGTVQFQH